jgi:hypothetical protein
MDDADTLRPKGTVEVRCGYPDCGVCWWLDPLDPRLPDGPFDCGDDHGASALIRRHLSMLRIRHGLRWGSMQPQGPERPHSDGCSRSCSAGIAKVWDREGGREGVLIWKTPSDIADPDVAAAAVLWDPATWPTDAFCEGPGWGPEKQEEIPPGHVRWVGYKTGESVRRYTFVKCVRPGCPNRLMVDTKDPDFRPTGYMVGSWGGDIMPEPAWWGTRTFVCEEGLSAFGTQPCALVHSDAIGQFEQMQGARWTVWGRVGEGGSVLFFDALTNRYGLYLYTGPEDFATAARIAQGIQYGSLAKLGAIVTSARRTQKCIDDVLDELDIQTKHRPS